MRKTMTALGGTIASTALLALLATNAMAIDSGESSINITGTVPPITYIPPPNMSEGSNPNNASFSGNTVTITELADDAAHMKASEIFITFPDVITNYAANIGLQSKNNGLMAAGYRLKYKAIARISALGQDTGVCIFAGSAPTCKISEPLMLEEFDIDVEITTDEDKTDVIRAGTYTDTLTLKIGASL